MTTTLLNNAPASSFRATPPEGRRWPCAAATIRAGDQQVITSPDSARAAESSLHVRFDVREYTLCFVSTICTSD